MLFCVSSLLIDASFIVFVFSLIQWYVLEFLNYSFHFYLLSFI